MDHLQANTSRRKLKTKLHSVPRGKANDYERSFNSLKAEAGVSGLFSNYSIPRARMGSESMAHEAEGGIRYSLSRGHEGEGNNCFVKCN